MNKDLDQGVKKFLELPISESISPKIKRQFFLIIFPMPLCRIPYVLMKNTRDFWKCQCLTSGRKQKRWCITEVFQVPISKVIWFGWEESRENLVLSTSDVRVHAFFNTPDLDLMEEKCLNMFRSLFHQCRINIFTLAAYLKTKLNNYIDQNSPINLFQPSFQYTNSTCGPGSRGWTLTDGIIYIIVQYI